MMFTHTISPKMYAVNYMQQNFWLWDSYLPLQLHLPLFSRILFGIHMQLSIFRDVFIQCNCSSGAFQNSYYY